MSAHARTDFLISWLAFMSLSLFPSLIIIIILFYTSFYTAQYQLDQIPLRALLRAI